MLMCILYSKAIQCSRQFLCMVDNGPQLTLSWFMSFCGYVTAVLTKANLFPNPRLLITVNPF